MYTIFVGNISRKLPIVPERTGIEHHDIVQTFRATVHGSLAAEDDQQILARDERSRVPRTGDTVAIHRPAPLSRLCRCSIENGTDFVGGVTRWVVGVEKIRPMAEVCLLFFSRVVDIYEKGRHGRRSEVENGVDELRTVAKVSFLSRSGIVDFMKQRETL